MNDAVSQIPTLKHNRHPRLFAKSMTTRIVAMTLLVSNLLITGCGQEKAPKNVILISIDTLRADRIGCYGYANAGTPNIDAFSAQNLRFANCFSPIPVTLPSHTSMMTGMIPPRHSVRDNGTFKVPEDVPTLATVLQGQGYQTTAVIGAFPLNSGSRFNRGFDVYDEALEERQGSLVPLFFDERNAEQVSRRAIEYLRRRSDQPFFLFVHFFDPHQPWSAPEPYKSAFRHGYDAEVAFTDRWVGEILNAAKELDLLDSSIVVITADHGDGLMEHGEISHSQQLYNTTQHVPLILHAPGLKAEVVDRPVGLVDIAPTIVELLGLAPLADIDGISLLREPDEDERLIYCETLVGRLAQGWNELRGCVVGSHKYIRKIKPELYDFNNDPHELRNLAADHDALIEDLDSRLMETVRARSTTYSLADRFQALDAETQANLQALGYLASSGAPNDLAEITPLSEEREPHRKMVVLTAINIARQAMSENDFLKAIMILERINEDEPGNKEVLRNLVTAKIFIQDYDGAVRDAEKLIELSRLDPVLIGLASVAYRGAGDFDRAIALANQAVDINGNADNFLTKARALGADGDHDAMFATLQQGLAENECNRVILGEMAKSYKTVGRKDDAKRAYEQMIVCGVGVARAWFNLGNLSLEAGDMDLAETQYSTALEVDPLYAAGHYGMAVLHYSKEEFGLAREEAVTALRLSGADSTFGRRSAALLAEIERMLDETQN